MRCVSRPAFLIVPLPPAQKLVAAEDASEAYTTFTGVTRLKQGITPSNTYADDAPALNRSATAPAPRISTLHIHIHHHQLRPSTNCQFSIRSVLAPPEAAPVSNLGRANTTINVASNARERISPGSPSSSNNRPPPSVARSNTMASGRTPGGMGGPVRGLSVRKPSSNAPSPPPKSSSPARGGQNGGGGEDNGNRMTEFYDSYIDAYADNNAPPTLPPLPPMSTAAGGGGDRVAGSSCNYFQLISGNVAH